MPQKHPLSIVARKNKIFYVFFALASVTFFSLLIFTEYPREISAVVFFVVGFFALLNSGF